MICDFYGMHRESIKLTDPHRHKYGDAIAEFLDREPNMYCDDEGGDVECPTGHFYRFGKRLLRGDDRGFIWVEKLPTVQHAKNLFEALRDFDNIWSDDEMPDDERERQLNVVRRYLDESDVRWMRGDPLPRPYDEWRTAHADAT